MAENSTKKSGHNKSLSCLIEVVGIIVILLIVAVIWLIKNQSYNTCLREAELKYPVVTQQGSGLFNKTGDINKTARDNAVNQCKEKNDWK